MTTNPLPAGRTIERVRAESQDAAEVWADPELLDLLTREAEGDFGPIPGSGLRTGTGPAGCPGGGTGGGGVGGGR